MNVPFSPYSQSGTHITKNADTSFVPGFVFNIWSAGLKVFAVEWAAPDTKPSAFKFSSFSIIIPKYIGSFNNSSACSKVIPLFFLSSYNFCLYSSFLSDVSGFIISTPSKSILFFELSSFIFSSSPKRITFANPCFITLLAASNTLLSSASGKIIVFLSSFALFFIPSINDIFFSFLIQQ